MEKQGKVYLDVYKRQSLHGACAPPAEKGCTFAQLRQLYGPRARLVSVSYTHLDVYKRQRLGEGTGAVAAMPLLDMARAVYAECYTFAQGGIEAYTPQSGTEEA